MKQDTRAIHGRHHEEHPSGAVNQPVYYSSTFKWSPEQGVRYIRFGNTPNQQLTGELLAALENVDSGTVAASGQAAIASALMTALKSGDHLLVAKGLYGGTVDVVRELLPRLGINCSEIDPFVPTSWQETVQFSTRALYCESLTSPLCHVPLLDELSAFAQDNGLLSIIDNTNPGATNFSPRELVQILIDAGQ